MQVQTPKPPMPPGEPTQITVVQTQAGVPQTIVEVRALRAQRTELSNQLNSAQGRRDDIVDALREASASERPGLEARLYEPVPVLDHGAGTTVNPVASRTARALSPRTR